MKAFESRRQRGGVSVRSIRRFLGGAGVALGLCSCKSSADCPPGAQNPPSGTAIAASGTPVTAGATEFSRLDVHGKVVSDYAGAKPAELKLERGEEHWQGTLREAEEAFTLVRPELLRLTKDEGLSTYSLKFEIDLCEHALPSPMKEEVLWRADLCRHGEAATRPQLLRRSELRLSVQTRTKLPLSQGPSYTVSALGSQSPALDAAYVLRGLALAAE